MKVSAVLIAIFFFTPVLYAQKAETRDAAQARKDSLFIDHYWQKAFDWPIYSEKRGKYIDTILMKYPGYCYMWQQRAMPLFKEKKYEAGMTYLDSAVKCNPVKWTDYRAFMKCIFSKNYHAALIDFEAAKKINSDGYVMDRPYDFYIGLCYLQLNKFDTAEKVFAQVMEDKKKQNRADWIYYPDWFYLGVCKYEKEDYAGAIACFDSCLAMYTNFADCKYYKALSLKNQGKIKAAALLMNEAKTDLRNGYTINEANAIYEMYPYRVYKDDLFYWAEVLNNKSQQAE